MTEAKITGRGTEVTKGIKTKIKNMLKKHKTFLEKATKIEVELRASSSHLGVDKDLFVEFTVWMPKVVIRVEEEGKDFYTIIDKMDPILKRRLVRYDDNSMKWKNRRLWGSKKEIEDQQMSDAIEDVYEDVINVEPLITRHKQYSQNYPMRVEEAIERMELLGHEAFLFKNIETKNYSMVYRRKDGSYGLVEPKTP